MTIKVFGHKSPDTDTTGSAIAWAWYLNTVRKEAATPVLLGKPNTEAAFVLEYWGLETPQIIEDVTAGERVAIVDTNNPGELPASIHAADIHSIIDHHKLIGGLETPTPIEIRIEPLACTASIIWKIAGRAMDTAPDAIKGVMLSCILSDTLEFRSPTTTQEDRDIATRLAKELRIDMAVLSEAMFAAKSDITGFSDAELLRMDSKKYTVGGTKLCVCVLETTAPHLILERAEGLMASMEQIASEDDCDQVLLFVVDILRQEATLLLPNEVCRTIAEKSFGVRVSGDRVVLPGVVSRKKQIIPVLAV